MPSGVIATIKSIEQEGQPLTKARAGDGVDIGLTGVDPGMLAPGGVLCHPDYPVPVATRFEIRILTLGIRIPILRGSQVWCHPYFAAGSFLSAKVHKPCILTIFTNVQPQIFVIGSSSLLFVNNRTCIFLST